ncbi:core-2/I-branching beta-1,6-N-acetylglucosaminyltransferase family protein [Actinidia rufa]|uniref:Core-2/I-branching beta-1,6-N-acetylglucosaminyltransferase family protein n=1 Tax=Actinidia rufa TaxID=165716 RepID=A0A7J0GC61_9ERIC|nr:core-2/I-branching beta-1,6-N-acetylglucosaminyltransferase family protein [Actinidia rufa]
MLYVSLARSPPSIHHTLKSGHPHPIPPLSPVESIKSMLSPSPLSLFCALLLCLPLAIVFTITTPLITTANHGSTSTIAVGVVPTTNKTRLNPVTALGPTIKNQEKSKNTTTTTHTPPPTPPPEEDDKPLIPSPEKEEEDKLLLRPVAEFDPNPPDTTITPPPSPKENDKPMILSPEEDDKYKLLIRRVSGSDPSPPDTTTTPPPLPPPKEDFKPFIPSPEEEEEDKLLLRRAAGSNPDPSSPRKLAFMFLTTSPLPFAPIWEMFFNQTPTELYNIYIHADPRIRYDPPFSGVFSNRVIPDSKPTQRYSPTLISAARRILARSLLHDPSNSMFALLSPACIPLHSFHFTYQTLVRSNQSFIEVLKNERGAYDRWAARGKHAMLPEVPFEEFRIGSQFFVLTRKHARMVVRDTRLWEKFKLPCLHKYTCYPEEHYFATLLHMEDPRGCVPATLTHVDWKGRRDGHPRTYTAGQLGPDLIHAFRRDRPRYGDYGTNGSDSSVIERRDPFLFARKFSSDSLQPLLRIANDVLFQD